MRPDIAKFFHQDPISDLELAGIKQLIAEALERVCDTPIERRDVDGGMMLAAFARVIQALELDREHLRNIEKATT